MLKPTSADPIAHVEARLDGILEAAVDGIILIDSRGRILEFNPAAERLFGHETRDVIGQNVAILMPEPHRSHHDDYLATYLRTKDPQIIGRGREVEGVRKDGEVFPMDLSVGEVVTKGQHLFVGIVRDITQRKQEERERAEREEQIRLTFDNAATAIAVMRTDGVLMRTNPEARRLWNRTAEELEGAHFSMLVPEDDQNRLAIELERLRSGVSKQVSFDLRQIRPDGDLIYAVLHVSAVPDKEGNIVQFVAQVVDHTEQTRAEREAREHRERLAHATRLTTAGEMAAGIAHEINQPLTAIATYAGACQRLLGSGKAEPDELDEALEQIRAQALRAGEVIRRLRSLVRPRESTLETAILNELVRDIAKLAKTDARVRDYGLLLQLDPSDPEVVADPIQIQQVVLNLIQNSRDAMSEVPHGNAIMVRTLLRQDGFVEVRVRDDGIGAPVGAEKNLFRPFFTTKESGMGMGLSICRSIIHSHGGELWFSENEDRGMTFHFTLPVATGDTE